METIIPPVDRALLKAELTPGQLLRTTSKSNNEIYVVTHHDAPNVLREIGRLREIAFRAAGGGTGKAFDLDEFDTSEHPYYQLLVWDPSCEEIIGGYRFLPPEEVRYGTDGQPLLATGHLFHFSRRFLDEYMPQTVELGRSFVSLDHQNTRGSLSRSLFALDNLWEGLGALTVIIPRLKYYFGKMTMYPSFNRQARDMILYFLGKHFGDHEGLVWPADPIAPETPEEELAALLHEPSFREDYRLLHAAVRRHGYNIPPLVNAYMGLSPTMRVFGTAVNHQFGKVEETGILIAVDEILEQKRMRYIDSYAETHPGATDIFKDLFTRRRQMPPKGRDGRETSENQ